MLVPCRAQAYKRSYISSVWNYLDLTFHFSFVAVFAMHMSGAAYETPSSFTAFKILMAYDCIVIWFKLLFYAKAFKGTGGWCRG